MVEQTKEQVKKTARDAFELVRLRNFFYRDNYRKLVSIVFLLMLLLLVMAYWVFYLISHRPAPRYFATNIQGGITPLYQLNQPGLSTDYVLNWAARGASHAFTFNYVEYREQIENAKDIYFTADGGEQFEQQLENSNDLQAVVQGKFIVTAQPGAAPQLLWQGVIPTGTYQGRYGWQVDLPMVLTIQNCTQVNKKQLDVKMTVVRSSYLIDNKAINIDGAKGIGIAQVLVQTTNPGQPVQIST